MKRILYLTDLYYEARGRRYCDEDIYIVGRLKEYFDVAICNLKNSEGFEKYADLVIVSLMKTDLQTGNMHCGFHILAK